jgi:hypothetical protein
MTISPAEAQVIDEVIQALRRLSHGHVQIIVQDAKVVQIEVLEKKRLDRR